MRQSTILPPEDEDPRAAMLRWLREHVAPARHARGVTQRQAAAALDVTVRTWRRWELGEHAPEAYLWNELARYLGFDMTEIDAIRRPRGPARRVA